MRIWSLIVAILVGLATTAHAKRLGCAPPLAAPDRIEGTRGNLASPVVHDVTFSADGVSINARFAPETVRVRLTYMDGQDHVELWTTPDRPFVCIPHVPHEPLLTSVFVFDNDGHLNMSLTSGTVIRERRGCGLGATMLVLALIPVGLIALAVLSFLRSAFHRRKLKQPGDTVSPLVAETMARAVIADLLVFITAGFTLSTLLYATDDPGYAALVAWIPVTRFLRLIIARRFLRRLERAEPAQLHDNVLATLDDHIVVPRAILRGARQRTVPTARRHTR